MVCQKKFTITIYEEQTPPLVEKTNSKSKIEPLLKISDSTCKLKDSPNRTRHWNLAVNSRSRSPVARPTSKTCQVFRKSLKCFGHIFSAKSQSEMLIIIIVHC